MYRVMAVFEAVDRISRTADTIARNVESMGSRTARVGGILQGVGMGLTKSVTLPLLGVGAAALHTAVNFDKAMMGVNSVLKLSEAEFQKLTAEVLEFSTTTSQSSKDVALALRGIVSSGFDTADAMTVLRVAVDAAGNMLANTETTTRALTSTLRAFGMEAGEVTHVADVLQTMANKSSLTFEALTGSIGEVVGMASAAKVPFETVAAAMMTVSDAGYSVSESAVAVRNLIQELLNPTDDLADAIKDWGYETGEAALAGLGLEGVLKELAKTTGGSAAEMGNLLGNVRASKAAFALSRQGGTAFAESLDEVSVASKNLGEHEAMRAVRHQSAAYHMAKLKSEVEVFAIRMGNVMLPVLVDVVDELKDFVTVLATLPPETIKTYVKVGALVAVLGPLLVILGKVVKAVGVLVTVLKGVPVFLSAVKIGFVLVAQGAGAAEVATLGFGAAVGALALPVTIAIAGIAGLYYLIREFPPPAEASAQSLEHLAEASYMLDPALYAVEEGTAGVKREVEATTEATHMMSEAALEHRDVMLEQAAAVNSTHEEWRLHGANIETATAALRVLTQAELDAAAGAAEASRKATEMAEIQVEAWSTFADSVAGAVTEALSAYRAGNADMLAEQQTALGQLLWNQTNTMLALGQITEDQAFVMKGAIAEQYGIMVDDSQLATDKLLTMFTDWSSGGETTAAEIVGFIAGIGEETAALVVSEEASIAIDLAAWERLDLARAGLAADEGKRLLATQKEVEEFALANQTETGNINDYWNDNADVVWATKDTWDKSMVAMATSMSTMEGNVATDSVAAVESIDLVGAAVNRLPDVHTITINVVTNAPPEFELDSPHFKFQTALGKLVDFAKMNQVQIGVGAGEVVPLSTGGAGGGGGNVTESYDQRRYESNVTVNGMGLSGILTSASRQV